MELEKAATDRLVADPPERTDTPREIPVDEPSGSEIFRSNADVARRVEQAHKVTRRLQETWRSLPIRDPRPLDEIIAYDEDGLPT